MKTLYYPQFDELVVTEQPVPEVAAGEVLMEVAACGICGSELESFAHRSAKRTPPIIMGHEFCGVIAATGTGVTQYHTGDRVVSNALVFCGECDACRVGATNLCRKRQVFSIHRNGAFGQFVNVPVSSLLPWPEGVPAEQACLAEPLANGVHMVALTKHVACKRVLILGAGPIGLMALQAFKVLRNATCYVSDINTQRLNTARQLGAADTLNPVEDDLPPRIREITAGEGVDIVVDAVGRMVTTQQAVQVVRPGGAVVLIGLQEDAKAISNYDLIVTEKMVTGSYAATQQDMATALEMIASGDVDVSSWVHTYPLSDGVNAFKDMLHAKNGHIKSVIIHGLQNEQL
ncbi:L-iditol 2-dehydrogenase [Filimonas zeae]|uniref:Galactitol-1-phosphate 5-dehydrogenase n=1 Tax=Filimonas zeae TaxID=1737353 RepID=A0A917IYN1_9BACT|nr:alcohol dehydrogenase catalytic domain-containing protein [Filimonas zeae]MDR6338997.1 L-iditol 2-dehydrogenase [Filimonas zeae]GGH65601.1 galactitol-1-phosphate 5-dehydrogenase [Filimonas zeae]